VLAIDTNVVVRYLTRDDIEQWRRAEALIHGEATFVAMTVLLETEWVLRSGYGYAPAEVVRALAALAGLPRVTIEDPPRLAQALDWTTAGMDFADALHLSAAHGCEAFASFDQDLAKRAAAGVIGVRVQEP
jgi:predicted nucleic-acid-binding protein